MYYNAQLTTRALVVAVFRQTQRRQDSIFLSSLLRKLRILFKKKCFLDGNF